MKKIDTKKLVILALLTGILVLMAYTPLGYLKVGALSITLNMIPVAIGAVALGPTGGAILGTVFGITSFVQCFGGDPFGTMLAGYSLLGTFVVCTVSRTLAGFLVGLIYKLLSQKAANSYVLFPVIGLLAAVFNTLFFMTSLMAIFGNTAELSQMRGGMNLLAFMCAFVGINAVFEIIASTVVTGAVAAALKKAKLIGTVTPKTEPVEA